MGEKKAGVTVSDVVSRAESLRVELQAVIDALPAYGSRPGLTVGVGVRLAELIAELARTIEEKQ